MERGHSVVGIDNLNDYYDPALKQARLARLDGRNNFTFCRLEVQDREAVLALAGEFPDVTEIVHLAAQAGVRYSLRSEEHTSELQSLMRISSAVFCLKKKTT